MFRLFLIEQLRKGGKKTPGRAKLPEKQYRNRRIYERFNIDHKHISLLNDQDILLIRDISSGGFCCEVGERCFGRLKVGDVYLCRIRYAKEIFEIKASVNWKSKGFIGFAIIDAPPKVQNFIERILTPARIGASLQELDPSLQERKFMHPVARFHGEQQSQLVVWDDSDGALHSWYFEYQDRYFTWNHSSGIESGILLNHKNSSLASPWESERKRHAKVDETLKQFVSDVFMALNYARSEDLVASLHVTAKEDPSK